MNGRVAKELRSRAQVITIGQHSRMYTRKLHGSSPTGTILLAECTRKAYKGLKRIYKSGVLGSVRPQQAIKRNRKAVQE